MFNNNKENKQKKKNAKFANVFKPFRKFQHQCTRRCCHACGNKRYTVQYNVDANKVLLPAIYCNW